MKRGLLFSIGGLMLAGAYIWMSPAEKNYYEPREQSLNEASAQGYAEYMSRIRRNPVTGKVEEADVIAAREQLQRMAKNSSSSLSLQWTEMGPNDMGGRTRSLLFDKDNPSKMWAGSVTGGIFHSPNGGRSWIPVDDQMENLVVTDLAQGADGAIYASTGENSYLFVNTLDGAGIFKSTDGGLTFSQLASTDPSQNPNEGWTEVGKIACDPTNANRIYAASSDGLKISNDGGTSWTTEISSGTGQDIVVTKSGTVWAKVGQRIWKSTDGSAGSFNEITQAGGNTATSIGRTTDRMKIAVSPSDENYVYVLVTTGRVFDRVYQSTDGGTTWSVIGTRSALLSMVDQSPFAVMIGVDPKDKERIIVGGLTMWEWSKDNGWFQIASQNSGSTNFYVHVDLHEIQWHPTDSNTIYVGNDGGIFKSTNDGFSWTEENKGYATIQFYKMAVGFDGVITGGTQDNGTIKIDPNSTLPKGGERTIGITQPDGSVFDGDGGYTAISHLDQEVRFKARQYGQIGRSINSGDEYSYFYNSKMAGRYNAFSFAFADFVTPYLLWEKLEDRNSIDSIAFVADTIKMSYGFGNGNPRYSSQFTKPQSSTKFVPESFVVKAGSQVVTSDASGTLSGDGTGTFDAVTGQYTVEFNIGTSLEIRASVATMYDPGAIIIIPSETGDIPITETIPNGLNPSDTFMVQDPVQSMFAVGLTAYTNASEPGNLGGGVWLTRDVLSNRTQIPEWWHIGALANGETPSCMAFSHDGDALFVGTNFGRVVRYSNLTNARTEETADIDINYLVNPPAPSNAVVNDRVIFSQPNRSITSIVIDTEDPDRLIITCGNYGTNLNHVFYTENARSASLSTSGFVAKDGNLPPMPVMDAVINYNDASGGQVILGTDLGVFTTDDITASNVNWTAENNGLANVQVFDLLQTRTIRYDLVSNTDFEGAIYAATHGRGIFRTGSTSDYVSIEEPKQVEVEAIEKLELFPNPAQNNVNVVLNLENRSDVKINVRDMSGKLVKAVSYNNLPGGTEKVSFSVQSLKNGNYVISVIKGQEVKTGKLVIVH